MENTIETIRVLAVSREPAVLHRLGNVASSGSWRLATASGGWDAIERMQSAEAPHLLVLDLPRGDADSLQFLGWLRRLRPSLPVLVLCHAEDAAGAHEATRLGATEIVIGPFDEPRIACLIDRCLAPSENVAAETNPDFFASSNLAMQKLRAQAALLAQDLKELETFTKRYLVAGDHELTSREMGLVEARAGRDHAGDPGHKTHPAPVTGSEDSPEQDQPHPESLKSLIQGVKSEAERNAIGAALQRTGWNRKAAARLLRVSYRTLLYKIEQYHMQAPEKFLSALPAEGLSVFVGESERKGKAS